MPVLFRSALLAALAVLPALAGCGQSLPAPSFSEIIRLPGGVLSNDEQQRAIQDMSEKRDAHESEVARKIEKSR